MKEKIINHLKANGDATARQIAEAIGQGDYPSSVIAALSEMRTDGVLTCDKKPGKGKDMWYATREDSAAPAEPDGMPADKERRNAAKVAATAAGAEVTGLRKRIKDLEEINRSLVADAFKGKGRAEELEIALDVAMQTIASLESSKAAGKASKAKKPAQPRKPFSVTGLSGYHAGGDKVTLFLDRRLNARSVTLPADKLAQLAEMAGG